MNTQKMHNYIWIWVGLMIAFAVTMPIAMFRVSQTEKFASQPFASEDCAGVKLRQKTLIDFWVCSQMRGKAMASQ